MHGVSAPPVSVVKQESPDPGQQLASEVQASARPEQVEASEHTPSMQMSPVSGQQSEFEAQDWPVPEQVVPVVVHVPLVPPGGTSQASPEQQSAVTVQVPPLGTQGVRHTCATGSHAPEQQSAPAAQVLPFGAQSAQVPAVEPGGAVQIRPFAQQSGAAAPTVQAEPSEMVQPGGGGIGSPQIHGTSTPPTQLSGEQQLVSLEPEHGVPRGLHVEIAPQRRTPPASGTHGAPPQH